MLPSTIPTVTVTARYLTPAGLALSGTVTFSAPTLLTHTASDVILGGPIVAQLDTDGRIKAVLPATDAPGMNPVTWQYTVTEQLSGLSANRTYSIVLPAAQTVVDLADLAPADPRAPEYVAVPGPPGPAGAQGPAGPAGAPGAVRSVNGKGTADIVLTPTDVQAVPAASVGAANGVAALDAAGRVPVTQLPPGTVDPVSSVNGRKGAVVLSAADVNALDQAAGDLRYVRPEGIPVQSVNDRTGKVVLDAVAVGAAPLGSAVLLSGAQSIDGAKTFTAVPSSAAPPTAPAHLARKEYVDAVATPGSWAPGDLGFKAWGFDPATTSGNRSQYCGAGSVYLMGIRLNTPATVSSVAFYCTGYVGGTLSEATYAGLYDANGTRVGVTGSLKDVIKDGATAVCPLTKAYDAPAGTYWVALLINGPTEAGKGPAFAMAAGAGERPAGSARMPNAFARYGRLPATGQATLPTSFSPKSVVTDTNALWAAVA
ncbi:phage tail protein [Streptomyces sp. NPDC001691]|uniref:phage tail protein n=1 Tax=unclassified Streptomyces TaxID=2593676 RepID=UPI000DEA406A|nr:phage tail protein [Streptomyces sp. SDr-06]RCH68217.1 phage tail protein [Streptomyces sp. SDr-06]